MFKQVLDQHGYLKRVHPLNSESKISLEPTQKKRKKNEYLLIDPIKQHFYNKMNEIHTKMQQEQKQQEEEEEEKPFIQKIVEKVVGKQDAEINPRELEIEVKKEEKKELNPETVIKMAKQKYDQEIQHILSNEIMPIVNQYDISDRPEPVSEEMHEEKQEADETLKDTKRGTLKGVVKPVVQEIESNIDNLTPEQVVDNKQYSPITDVLERIKNESGETINPKLALTNDEKKHLVEQWLDKTFLIEMDMHDVPLDIVDDITRPILLLRRYVEQHNVLKTIPQEIDGLFPAKQSTEIWGYQVPKEIAEQLNEINNKYETKIEDLQKEILSLEKKYFSVNREKDLFNTFFPQSAIDSLVEKQNSSKALLHEQLQKTQAHVENLNMQFNQTISTLKN